MPRKIIFIITIAFSLLVFATGTLAPNLLLSTLGNINKVLLNVFAYWYLVAGLFITLVALVLLFLPMAKQRLGDEPPEYSFFSWIALLYSTGMGSGLLLRAIQEPVFYQQNPPVLSHSAEQVSLTFSFFHWGFTPWAMYSIFGLIVSYNLYREQTLNYLDAILANSNFKAIKTSINLFIVLITIVGVIASLGFGASQFMAGANHLFDLEMGNDSLLIIVFTVGLIATLSALTGIKRVIKYLANFDFAFSILLMLFVAVFLNFSNFFTNTFGAFKNYLHHFLDLNLSIGSYNTSFEFTTDWTVFYWAFWLAWVPFTGIFIARISKGRTIRQFIISTILIPAIATMIWFSVFGNAAFDTIAAMGTYAGEFDNLYTSLFLFLETLPFSQLTVILTALLVLTAIINSVDSAIFVLSMFSDNGNENPRKKDKVIWGTIITVTALGLCSTGTQDLLSAVSSLLIIMALPFSFLYIWLIVLFIKNLITSGK